MAMSALHLLSAGTLAGAVRSSSGRATVSGLHTLPIGQALSFAPRRDTVFRVSQGQAWITTGVGVINDGAMKNGDQVLQAGQTILLKMGQSVVIEGKGRDPLVYHFPKYASDQPNLEEQPTRWFQRFQWGRTDGSMLFNR